MASAKASMTLSSAEPGWSRLKIECTKARSIGRRFLARNSGSFLARSASVGLPLPVHTMASRASRDHHFGMVLGKQRGAQRPGRNPVDEQRLCCRAASGCRSRRRNSPRPRRRSGHCCRGSWWSAHNPPCRPTKCRSHAARRIPSQTNPAAPARRDRRSAATPSTSHARTEWWPRAAAGSPAHLFHRNSLTSPLLVQCSVPARRVAADISFMNGPFVAKLLGGDWGWFGAGSIGALYRAGGRGHTPFLATTA